MSARRPRLSGLSPNEQNAAQLRITAKFAPHAVGRLSPDGALRSVASGSDSGGGCKGATAQDVLDALGLAGPARFHLEVAELEVIAYARHVLHIEWEQIGRQLGYADSAAKQGAAARYARLAGRYPWVVAEIKKKAAASSAAADEQGDEQQ